MNSVFYLLLHPNKLLSNPYPANTRWIRQWWSDLNSALKFVQIRLFTTMNAITFDNATTSPSPSSGLNIYAQLSPTFYLCLVIYDAIIALATSLGNFLLLVVIYRDPLRCLRTPTTSLIANLGVADFFVGAFLGFGRTVEMYFLYKGHQEPQYLNTFQYFIGALAMFAAVCSIMAMSWDRFVAVTDPINYKNRITVKKVKLYILLIWLNALFLAVLPAAGVRKLDFLFAYCYSHVFVPAIVLTIAYVVVFKTLSKKLGQFKRRGFTENPPTETHRNYHHEKKLVFAIFLVLVAFYMCFAPFFVKVHLWFFCSQCDRSPAFLTYHFISNDILSLSALIDPLIYACRLQSFRKTFFRVLGFRRNAINESA